MSLITAKALAEMLSISVRTVWRLRSAGKLPQPVTVGSSSIRWKWSDVQLFIECDCNIDKFNAMRAEK